MLQAMEAQKTPPSPDAVSMDSFMSSTKTSAVEKYAGLGQVLRGVGGAFAKLAGPLDALGAVGRGFNTALGTGAQGLAEGALTAGRAVGAIPPVAVNFGMGMGLGALGGNALNRFMAAPPAPGQVKPGPANAAAVRVNRPLPGGVAPGGVAPGAARGGQPPPAPAARPSVKTSAQDNSQPRLSATGESQGLSFRHREDDYAKGQAAWKSLSKYFKGGKAVQDAPNPYIGKHADDVEAEITVPAGDQSVIGNWLRDVGTIGSNVVSPVWRATQPYRAGASLGGGVGLPLGAIAGLYAGMRRDRPFTGLLRGSLRGLTTGSVAGAGSVVGSQLARLLGGGPGVSAVGTAAGGILGGLGGYLMAGKALGEPVVSDALRKRQEETDKPAKKRTNKAAEDVSPLARGFFARCAQEGLSLTQTKEAAQRIDASKFGLEAKQEILSALEKSAGFWSEAARLLGVGGRAVAPAAAPGARALPTLAQTVRPLTGLAGRLGPAMAEAAPAAQAATAAGSTASAAATGARGWRDRASGFVSQLGAPAAGGLGGYFTAPAFGLDPLHGAVLGAASMAPGARRAPLARPVQHAIGLGTLGNLGDTGAGWAGHDTGGALGRYGARAGALLGAGHMGAQLLSRAPGSVGAFAGYGSRAGDRAIEGVNSALTGVTGAITRPITYPLQAGWNTLRHGTPPWRTPYADAATGAGQLAQRVVGIGALGGLGAAGVSAAPRWLAGRRLDEVGAPTSDAAGRPLSNAERVTALRDQHIRGGAEQVGHEVGNLLGVPTHDARATIANSDGFALAHALGGAGVPGAGLAAPGMLAAMHAGEAATPPRALSAQERIRLGRQGFFDEGERRVGQLIDREAPRLADYAEQRMRAAIPGMVNQAAEQLGIPIGPDGRPNIEARVQQLAGNMGGNIGGAITGFLDNIFKAIGINPEGMGTLQKWLMVGGTVASLLGLITGNHAITGAGGVAALAGGFGLGGQGAGWAGAPLSGIFGGGPVQAPGGGSQNSPQAGADRHHPRYTFEGAAPQALAGRDELRTQQQQQQMLAGLNQAQSS